jgi:hypothetical protein
MAFQGSLKELPLPDIIQLVSVSGKTGMFSLTSGASKGEIYLRDGQIVHAEVGKLREEEAVYEMAIWRDGEFVFIPGKETQHTSIRRSNTNLLMEAARRIDEWSILSKKIPSTQMVPVFTNQATTTSVSLTPQEWMLISKTDERRTIEELAIAVGMSPFEVCKLLYGLITSGLLTLRESLASLPSEHLKDLSPEKLDALAVRIYRMAQQGLKDHNVGGELEKTHQLCKAEMDAGRHADAILDQIRSLEKLVSSALGPNQANAYMEKVSEAMKNA